MTEITIAQPSSLSFLENYTKALEKPETTSTKQTNKNGSGSSKNASASKISNVMDDYKKIQNLNTSNSEIMNILGKAAAADDPMHLQILTEALSMRNNMLSVISNIISKMGDAMSGVIRNIR